MTNIKNIGHERNVQILEGVDLEFYRQYQLCPYCGEDVFRERADTDDEFFPVVRIPVECESCSKKWFEVYELKELWIRSK